MATEQQSEIPFESENKNGHTLLYTKRDGNFQYILRLHLTLMKISSFII